MWCVLFDPNCFFISDEDWGVEETQMAFREHLNAHIGVVNSSEEMTILWSDKLEARLWGRPKMFPWKEDKQWNYSMKMSLYHTFMTKQKIIDTEQLEESDVRPEFGCCCQEAFSEFRKLAGDSVTQNRDTYFCLGVVNDIDGMECCADDDEWTAIDTVKSPKHWVESITSSEFAWPADRTDREAFRKCIEYEARGRGYLLGDLHGFKVSNRFMVDIVGSSEKERIVKAVVKRLSMTKQEASADHGLQEHDVSARPGIMRFRVSQRPSSLRIQYEYDGAAIKFLNFYEKGEHDNGLR